MKKLSTKRFEEVASKAIDKIPEEFLEYLDNTVILVEQHPSRELLREMEVPDDETLLGVYLGVPVGEQSFFDVPGGPAQIMIFKKPLEEICETEEELVREIEVTIIHEIAHHFGIDDETLAEYGYG